MTEPVARPIYIVQLKPEPEVDGQRALQALLKIALRRYGLRCVGISRGGRHE